MYACKVDVHHEFHISYRTEYMQGEFENTGTIEAVVECSLLSRQKIVKRQPGKQHDITLE